MRYSRCSGGRVLKIVRFSLVWQRLCQKRIQPVTEIRPVFFNSRKGRRAGIFIQGAIAFLLVAGSVMAIDLRLNDADPAAMPAVGAYDLKVISSSILELTLVTSKDPDPARVREWDFVGDNFQLNAPATSEFSVWVDGQPIAVKTVGFKRRPLYAPLKQRDLRLGNYLYLELAQTINNGQTVEVKNPSGRLWTSARQFTAVADPLRWSPAIHVNQVGYSPGYPKKAMVGYYLGSMGELKLPVLTFQLVDAAAGKVVYQGQLTSRADWGYKYTPTPYQSVYQADFSAFNTPGEYRLVVPGLGGSFPFLIDDGTPAAFARTFALGLFHQRCGFKEDFPFTRFPHDACHTAAASVPDMTYQAVQRELANMSSSDPTPNQTAPQLKDVNSSLYPFVNQGKIDVSGGHHDAGDYSKYTINSSGLIHYLVFAADSFPGAGDLDNLGIPESGDGKSDLLQEAKWEADYLAKMQDADGGFYFLVYPRDREYEDDVLPDHGDPQVVFPKTTAVTAAATAALAETASSPRFQQQFPVEAALYLEKAKLGWAFLERAIAQNGKDGAYQKITHYGNEFMHDDELAWAAAAMFVATGDPAYQEKLMSWYNPSDPNTRRWTWWRLFEGYGCAARTYAFAARSGRLAASQLNATYLAKCEAEIQAAAQDQVRFAQESAYGTSFPDLNKGYRSAGWYFSSERAFDVTVAYQLTPREDYLDTIVSNLNYEGGCNPVNMTYVTGLGWKRQRDIVHQYAQNDHAVLPPSGIPLGNVQSGFPFLYFYRTELTAVTFPADNATSAPYPYYDRWADTFNTTTEFVVVDAARSVASLSFLMAQGPTKAQAWRSAAAQITGLPAEVSAETPITASIVVPGVDLTHARILWEARDQEPNFGANFTFAPKFPGLQWVEVEAQLPDGRRVFAATNLLATSSLNIVPNGYESGEVTAGPFTAGLYHLNGDLKDATAKEPALGLQGNAALDANNLGWMTSRTGTALRVNDLGDKAAVFLSGSKVLGKTAPSSVTVEAMVYINAFKAYNRQTVSLLSISQSWNAYLRLMEDPYSGPHIQGGTQWDISGPTATSLLPMKKWFHLSLSLDKAGYTLKIDGQTVATKASPELSLWNPNGAIALELGNFDGWVDEVVISGNGSTAPGSGGQITPANLPPTVQLTYPVGVPQDLSGPVWLQAMADDPDGSVAKVEFFEGPYKIGEVLTPPFQLLWQDAFPGVYSVTAKATDNQGATTVSSPVSVTLTLDVPAPAPAVEPPAISPNGGSYTGSVLVTLSSATTGATIYYTTDGSQPNSGSTVYSAPFKVAASSAVRAMALKSGAPDSAVSAASFTITAPPVADGPKATFVKADSTTQGAWKGAYGSDGFNIIGNYATYPSYVRVVPSQKSNYTWEQSSSDPRALEKSGANTDRISSAWFSDTEFAVDVNFIDGASHRLALYFVDWDTNDRKETVELSDPATGAVLDSQTLSQFNGGRYLVWDIQGAVHVRFIKKGGFNAVLMGLFFGPVPPGGPDPSPTQHPGTAAGAFVRTDDFTQGSWRGYYGSEGFNVIGDHAESISSIQVTADGQSQYIWTDSTTDVRALQRSASLDRVAVCWYAPESFTINANLTDGQVHRVSLYFLDWDSQARVEKVEVLDGVTGTLIDARTVSEFEHGRYLVWNARGPIQFRISHVSGGSALVMGLFFDAAPGVQLPNGPLTSVLKPAPSGELQVQVKGELGKAYIVEASSDLTAWTPIWSNTLTTSSSVVITDSDARNQSKRFYRTRPL